MPIPIPLLPLTGLLTFELVAGGKSHDNSAYQVHAITVTKGINRISEACIELVDGDPTTGNFTAIDSNYFKPGQPIEVQAGYENSNQPIFKGIVVSLGLATRGGQGTVLTVLCKDEAVKMTGSRVIRSFPPQPTSDALQTVVSQYGGISASIAPTSGVQNNLVQYNTTDWDFIVTQAEANGQVVISDMGKLATVALATASRASVGLVYGTNVLDFSLRIDARTQFASVTAQAWSATQQQELQATARPPGLTLPGDLTSAELATAVGQQTYPIRTAADVDQPTLQALADGYLAQRTLALLQGTVDTEGTSTAVPGTMASLAGFATHFNGLAIISGVRHTIAEGNWKTQLSLGTDEQWFAGRYPNVIEPVGVNGPASGIQGLYSAVVKAIQPDPEGGFRVQVMVAGLAGSELWVRLTQPYASAGVGLYFYPEIGDEVVLGFLGDDVRCPAILGSLYSKERAPAYPPDEKNTKKAIVTSSKLTLEFDENDKKITLTTPGNNKLVISDAGKGLLLMDQQQNTITLSDSGIELVSTSSVRISAANDIALESQNGTITISGSCGVALKGLDISASATGQLTLSSDAESELSSTGETVVKGTMVRIN